MIKRIHITFLLSIILLNSVQKINGVEPPDLTFVVKNNGSNYTEFICIAEGNVLNSAIGWIYPIADPKDKLVPQIVSSYVPDIKNDYDCNFSKKQYCNSLWKMEDWQNSKFDSHNFKPTLDPRWEDFPTIRTSNSTIEFNTRIAIPHVFEIGLSVRATKNAEIFLCAGWNPHNYPCYYINIGGSDNKQTFLRKYKRIPDRFSKNDTKLTKFKSDVGILSEDEWKSFILSLNANGTLKLIEKYKNTTLLDFTDKTIQPIYLFVRSKVNTALWKIANNFIDQYIYTNKTKVSQLGPTFGIYGNDLCLSLYVSMCKHCKMIFFMWDNGEKIILQEIHNEKNEDDLMWKQIKLLQHNILDDKLKLFVETKYANNTFRNGFWAIDDVRVCAENEIRLTQLLMKMDIGDIEKSHFSCQALNFPTWRPPQHISSSSAAGEEIKYTASTPTSVRLSWKNPVEGADNYQEYYLVQYEGIDICSYSEDYSELLPRNKLRQKSQGYVIGRSNEIVINNLTPYTYYNITLWNVIRGNKKSHKINTLPTDVPTKEELPRNLTMTVTDTTNEMEWNNPKCNETYGPIIYQINIKSKNGNDSRAVTDIKTKYKFENLLPYSSYSVEIKTSREFKYLNVTNLSIKTVYNFTTLPGIAPSVKNLELYATDKNSAYLRYDLPSNLRGTPKEVQIQWCHPLFLAGCQTEIRNLTKCKLWTQKYCIDIDGLITGYDYKFVVSIKNGKTPAFGQQESVLGTAIEKVPGTPINLTRKMIELNETVDYNCNVKISWAHPYNQNATITMFDIILNETSYSLLTDTWKSMHEILKIENKAYQPAYSYIIKYLPCNTPYKISVRAANYAYQGSFASINIKTDDIGDYVDTTPSFVKCTNETVVFKLPQLDWRLKSSTLIVIVQDYDSTKTHISDEIVNLEIFENENRLCNDHGNTWIAKAVKISNTSSSIVVIGDGTSSYLSQLNKSVVNKPLKPDTEYCFTFTLINQYKNSENLAVYHEKHFYTEPNYTAFPHQKEKPEESTNVAAYLVPILFVSLWIVCAIWFIYRYLKKRKLKSSNGEHIYETMPFEEYTPDAVSNQTYDRLIHD